MRTYNLLMTIWGALVLAVVGAISLIAAVYPPVILGLGDLISGPLSYAVEGAMGRIVALLAGGLLLLAGVYFVWGNWLATRRERTVVLQTPMGEVLVSLPAIEDFARVLKGKIEGLRDIKGRVVYTRRGLKVSARITVLAEYSIVEISQKIQEAIRNYIQHSLGINQEINPTVVVSKVVSRERPAPPSGLRSSM